jgi:hypothetical protein
MLAPHPCSQLARFQGDTTHCAAIGKPALVLDANPVLHFCKVCSQHGDSRRSML